MDTQGAEQSQASYDSFWRPEMEKDPRILSVQREGLKEV